MLLLIYYKKKIKKLLLKDYNDWFVEQELDKITTLKQARKEYKRLKRC